MQRSINAVLFGTFTLRFSTGLTGAMLLYYLAELPAFGGVEVSGTVAGIMTAAYFGAELIGCSAASSAAAASVPTACTPKR